MVIYKSFQRQVDAANTNSAVVVSAASTSTSSGRKCSKPHYKHCIRVTPPTSSCSTQQCTRALLVFLLCFAMYISTMSRSISGGDAAELAACACSISSAHPPGYPLFVFIYHTALRIATTLFCASISPALVFNLLSAFLSASAAALLCSTIETMGGGSFQAVFGALMFAFSSTVWRYAAQAEVFALNNFLLSFLLRLAPSAMLNSPENTRKSVSLAAFVSGLAMCNQHTAALFILPFAASLYLFDAGFMLHSSSFLVHTMCFLLGLLPNAMLALLAGKPRSWGELRSISGVLNHLLRREYGTFRLETANNVASVQSWLDSTPARFCVYLVFLIKETYFVGVVFAVFGAVFLLSPSSPHRRVAATMLASWFFYILVFSTLNRMSLQDALSQGVQERFWPQAHLIVCIFAGFGVDYLRRRLASLSWIFTGIAVALLSVQMQFGWRHRDYSSSNVIQNYAQLMVSSLPENATILLQGDAAYGGIAYLQSCENIRSDLALLHLELLPLYWFAEAASATMPSIVLPGSHLDLYGSTQRGYSIEDLLRSNINASPIVLCSSWADFNLSAAPYSCCSREFKIRPLGFCQQIERREHSQSVENLENSWRTISRLAPLIPRVHSADSWEAFIHTNAAKQKAAIIVIIVKETNWSTSSSSVTQMVEETIQSADSLQVELGAEFYAAAINVLPRQHSQFSPVVWRYLRYLKPSSPEYNRIATLLSLNSQ